MALVTVVHELAMRRIVTRFATTVVVAILALAVASCGKDKQEVPPPAPVAPAAPAQPAAAAAGGQDVSKLQACDIVKPAEVAKIAGGTLASEPSGSGPNCMYVVEVANVTQSYKLSFQPPAPMEELFKVMSPEEKAEQIAGQWDEAWFGKQPMGSGFHLLALRRGDLAIEVSGARKEPILEIATLAASRVQ